MQFRVIKLFELKLIGVKGLKLECEIIRECNRFLCLVYLIIIIVTLSRRNVGGTLRKNIDIIHC